ncbi:MFS-type transporter involved in bile tolerance, Atg22 family [Actinacidiphila alni]|uniref:MFS-type transporter involved in bile tolerance, Atg22 family n=1 Tax=Actinacidiphila alni TaxID=380248 RepID=A0A1I2HDD3_9ACTN|nr:MFS transporter [Actinacidiphila alni]SFF27320.1 MFS-type transporter involved in bile tolerance, Atg22 family [Actinacidiphila alni]
MTAAAGDPAPISVARDRRFLRFWAGQTVSQFGDRISELALPLIAVGALHASANQVAWLTALVWTPNLLAIVLGAWVDQQVRKRRLMVAADLVRAGVLLSLPVAHAAGAVTLGQLYAVALLTGAAGVLFNTAYPPFFAHLVPRAAYLDANSRLSASRSASFVAGPAVGGGLVQALTAPVAVAADALSFLASALLIGRLRVTEPPVGAAAGARDSSLLRRSREGLAYVMRHPVLRAGLGCSTTVNFFTFVSGSGLIVLFASRGLGLSAGVIGLAFGIGSTGGLLGAVLAPRVSRSIGLGRSIVVGAVLFPAPIALAAAADGPVWVGAGALAAAEFLSALGVMLFDVNLNSLQASVIPDGMRSRVAGAYSTVNYGVRPLGAVVGGLLATFLGLRMTLLVAAVGGALSVLWLLPSPVPGIRALGRDDGQPRQKAADDAEPSTA